MLNCPAIDPAVNSTVFTAALENTAECRTSL